MSYDANGNLTQTANADGNTVTYTYDPLNRKTGEYDGTSSSAPPIATWVYDNANNAVSGMTDPIGQLTAQTSYDRSGDALTAQQAGFNVFGGRTPNAPTTSSGGVWALVFPPSNIGPQYPLCPLSDCGTGTPQQRHVVLKYGVVNGRYLKPGLASPYSNPAIAREELCRNPQPFGC